MTVHPQRPGDRGKRRAYLAVLSLGLLATALSLSVGGDGVPRVLFAGILAANTFVLIGLVTRRLPMAWADWLVFGILAGALGFTLLRGAVDPAAEMSSVEVIATMVWACLVFPLAFLVFGTRRGIVISALTFLVFGVGTALTVRAVSQDPAAESSLLFEVAAHVALAYAAMVGLLWVLSTRLELLVRQQARADLLATEATTDPLTGVANRRRLTDDLDRLMAQARRHGEPLSVALLDLDEFKLVNDRLGHDEGDVVLIEAVRRLEGGVRAGDIVGRWGGEEFLLVLPHADLGAAAALADRCRRALAAEPIENVGVVTASFGVAMLSHDDDRRTLLRRADLAMYSAKREGRNRVVSLNGVYSPAELPADQDTNPT